MSVSLASLGIELFCATLEAVSGLCYTPDKDYLFESRLRQVIESHQIRDYVGLTSLLHVEGEVRQQIVEALVTSETFFFRDEPTFTELPRHVQAFASADAPVILWSVGSSSGQEAYSICMAIEEGLHWPLSCYQVHGFDISAPVLERARSGVYSEFETSRGLSPERRAMFMERITEGWRVREPWRSVPTWHQGNVLEGVSGLPQPHVIFCRNILIYFNDANKEAIVRTLVDQLHPGGLLVLGNSETGLAFGHLLEPLATGGTSLYRKPPG